MDNTVTKKKKQLKVELGQLTEKNIEQLRLLNSVIFPVRYNDKFYKDLLNDHFPHVLSADKLTKLAYYTDVMVGAVCCRLERKDAVKTHEAYKLYIMTLGVLASYRKYGIGTQLLQYVLELCKDKPQIEEIYLHVQVSNEDAIAFYNKFDFQIVRKIENYYQRIEPRDCFVLEKSLKKTSASDSSAGANGTAVSQ